MKIVFAADPFALSLRKAIVDHLKSKGYEVVDYGASEENTEIRISDAFQCNEKRKPARDMRTGFR